MAIVTYNDNGTIKVVKYGNYVVSTDADPIDMQVTLTHNGKSAAGNDAANGVEGMFTGTNYYFRFLALGGFNGNEWKFSSSLADSYSINDRFELTIDANYFNTLVVRRKQYNESNWEEHKIPFNQSFTITAYRSDPTLVSVGFDGAISSLHYVAKNDGQDSTAMFYLTHIDQQWVYQTSVGDPGGIPVDTFNITGEQEYYSQGCASLATLKSALTSAHPPQTFSPGSSMAVRALNAVGGTCNTWALFKVQ